MKVVEIRNVVRKDDAVLYRRSFTGEAILSDETDGTQARKIEFVLEHTAGQGIQVSASFVDPPEAKTADLIDALRKHIADLDQQGKLP